MKTPLLQYRTNIQYLVSRSLTNNDYTDTTKDLYNDVQMYENYKKAKKYIVNKVRQLQKADIQIIKASIEALLLEEELEV